MKKGHDKNVDWWTIGIMIYEMLFGVSPFYDNLQNNVMRNIMKSRVKFPW